MLLHKINSSFVIPFVNTVNKLVLNTLKLNYSLILIIIATTSVSNATSCEEAVKKVKKGVSLSDDLLEEQSIYQEAIKLCPQLAEAHHNLAINYIESGKIKDAKAEIQKAIALRGSVDFRLVLAHIYLLEQDHQSASSEYKMVLDQAPDNFKALQGLSFISASKGERKKAEEYLEKALEQNPLDEVSLYNRAVLSEQLGNPDLSIRNYKELLRVNSAHREAATRLAYLLKSQGDLVEARDVLSKALASQKNKSIHLYGLHASLCEELGEYDEAEVSYKRILSLKANDEEALVSLASLYVRKRQHQLALETLKKLFQGGRGHGRGYTIEGIVYLQLGKFDKAKSSLLKAIKEDPTQAVAHYNLALVYKHFGDKEHYQQEIERAKVLDPTLIE